MRADSYSPPFPRPRRVAGVFQPLIPSPCPLTSSTTNREEGVHTVRLAPGAAPFTAPGRGAQPPGGMAFFFFFFPSNNNILKRLCGQSKVRPVLLGGPFVPGGGTGGGGEPDPAPPGLRGARSSPPSSRRSGDVIKGDRALKGFD